MFIECMYMYLPVYLKHCIYIMYVCMYVTHVPFAGSTDMGPRFDKQGTFLPHSVLGPTDDYTAELKNAGTVRSFIIKFCTS